MINRSAGAIIVGPSGKIVVVNQNGDSWSLPKGRLEPGETARRAALREVYEETGLKDVKLLKNLGNYTRPTIGKGGLGEDTESMKNITIFLAKTDQLNLQPQDPDNPEAIWLAPDKVAALLHHVKDKQFFERQLPEIHRLLSGA